MIPYVYMGRLIDKRQWAFTDYLTIIESLNRVEVDTFSLPLVASAHRFMPVWTVFQLTARTLNRP